MAWRVVGYIYKGVEVQGVYLETLNQRKQKF